MTPLQSQILGALRQADPRPLTDVEIWAATGGHELGGHGTVSILACLELEKLGLIQLDDLSAWKLTSEGRDVGGAGHE